MPKNTIRYKACQSADKALVNAWDERGGRFGEDGPVAIIEACRAYDAVIMRKIKAVAKRRGILFEDFVKEVQEELGPVVPRKESMW